MVDKREWCEQRDVLRASAFRRRQRRSATDPTPQTRATTISSYIRTCMSWKAAVVDNSGRCALDHTNLVMGSFLGLSRSSFLTKASGSTNSGRRSRCRSSCRPQFQRRVSCHVSSSYSSSSRKSFLKGRGGRWPAAVEHDPNLRFAARNQHHGGRPPPPPQQRHHHTKAGRQAARGSGGVRGHSPARVRAGLAVAVRITHQPQPTQRNAPALPDARRDRDGQDAGSLGADLAPLLGGWVQEGRWVNLGVHKHVRQLDRGALLAGHGGDWGSLSSYPVFVPLLLLLLLGRLLLLVACFFRLVLDLLPSRCWGAVLVWHRAFERIARRLGTVSVLSQANTATQSRRCPSSSLPPSTQPRTQPTQPTHQSGGQSSVLSHQSCQGSSCHTADASARSTCRLTITTQSQTATCTSGGSLNSGGGNR